MRPTRAPLRPLPLALAACLVVGNLFMHLPISDVCDWARARWGFPIYDRFALIGIPLLTIAALIPLLRRHRDRWQQPATWCVALSLLVMSLAAQRWMLVANIEIIHFPQFGLIAGLLLAAGVAAEPAWLLASAAGIVDETYQELVLYAGRKDTYLDFNDMILDAIGAAWIVIAFAPATTPRRSWLTWPRAALWLLPIIAIALLVAPPQLSPFLRVSAGFTLYRVIGLAEALIWAAMLWGMVALAVGGGPSIPRRGAGGGSLILFALLLGCTAQRLPAAEPPPRAPFITTFWCGPPLGELDDARAAEIAAAGFTVIGAPCEGMINAPLNKRALDVAARHGLQMWIMDHRYNPLAAGGVDHDAIAAAVADYRDHPAFAGYFVVDEPTSAHFDRVKEIVDVLHRLDPTHVAYVNLLPEYVEPDGRETPGYAGYVDEFVAAIQPRLLSYDYYPFGKNKDRSTFFSSLGFMRERARRYRLPLLLIILAMPHGPYREPSEAELAWQAYHALAYGARGLSYFAYWTPVHVEHAEEMNFRYGLIEGGRPTAIYFRAQRINRDIRAIAAQLDAYESMAVVDALGEVAPPFPLGPLDGIDGGPITTGFFAHADGHLAAVLVNRDYRYGSALTLRPRAGSVLPETFDPGSGKWQRLTLPQVSLPPGEGRLLRWR